MLNGKSVSEMGTATGIKGVFYVDDNNPEYFNKVSKEQLKLKDY